MSTSETITRTDLTNILNEVLPIASDFSHAYGGNAYKKTGVSYTSGQFVGTSVQLAKVSDTSCKPIVTGVDVSGTGTSTVYLIGFYPTTTTIDNTEWWVVYVKTRNSGSSAISGATVNAYVIWV